MELAETSPKGLLTYWRKPSSWTASWSFPVRSLLSSLGHPNLRLGDRPSHEAWSLIKEVHTFAKSQNRTPMGMFVSACLSFKLTPYQQMTSAFYASVRPGTYPNFDPCLFRIKGTHFQIKSDRIEPTVRPGGWVCAQHQIYVFGKHNSSTCWWQTTTSLQRPH